MKDAIDWRIIDRHLAGAASPGDTAELQRWIAEDPRRAELLTGIRADVRNGEATPETDAAWSTLSARLHPEQVKPIPLAKKRELRRTPSWTRRGGVASLAAAVLMLAVWALGSRETTRAEGFTEVVAPDGEQKSLLLSDGSRVTLNAGSTLRYPSSYGAAASRDVQLVGEGYFVVAHDANHPFRVHASNGVAEDLGTAFVVRAYPELGRVEVAVTEGRVLLRRDTVPGDSVTVGAGQLARLTPAAAPAIVPGVNLERWTAWTEGALVLDGLRLGDAAVIVGHKFDVDIRIADSTLASRRVSARFRDDALPTVMDALSFALDTRWTRSGRTIRIGR